MAKLGEVCTIVSGSTPKTSVTSYWDGNIKWITPAELNEDTFYIMDSVRHITEEGKEKTGLSYLPTGTVILSSRAPIGKTAIAGCKMCCNQGFKNLICSDAIYNEYLYFFLKSKTDYLNSLGRGATFKEISKSIVENIEIPLPEVNQQKEIAEKFKKLEQLISLRKQQLAKLDELVKARFVEMFGDPDQNPKGWPLVSVTEIIRDKASNGFFAKRDAYKDDGNVQILGVSNVVNRMYSNTKELPRTNATQAEKEKYSVKYGDMLFCRSSLVADGIGKASIVAKGTFPNVLFECHVIRLSLDLQKCVPEFVQVLSTTPFFRRQIIAQSKTATMTTIGQDGILKSSVVLPPIDLQNQFAAFVERVDQQKQTIQQSLEKLELMKKALMQEYFG